MILLPLLLACAAPEPAMVTELRELAPVVIAHRGGDDLAPEGTIPAFSAAWDAGAAVLEIDLYRSTDGVIFVFHDDTVDRTTDGTGPTESLSWEELLALDAGYHWSPDGGETHPYRGEGLTIPSLDEVFLALPDDARLNLDIKSRRQGVVDDVVDIVEYHRAADRVCIGSFDAGVAQDFRAALPDACHYYSEGAARWQILGDLAPVANASSPRFHLLEVPVESAGIRVVTEGFVRRAHRRHQLVWPWTINEREAMRDLLALGVDGLITDEVARALDVVATDARRTVSSGSASPSSSGRCRTARRR